MSTNKKEKKRWSLPGGGGIYVMIAVALLSAGVLGRSVSALRAALPKNTETTAAAERTAVSHTQSPVTNPAAQVRETVAITRAAPSEQAVFGSQTPVSQAEQTTAAAAQRFSLPVNGGVIADYSMGVPVFSATMGDYRTHNGVDLRAEPGAEVRAVGDGTVISVADDRLYGNVVTVDHGNGVVSTLCGLADADLIRSGAVVDASTVIGRVGELPAEAKEESHVHLEVRKNGVLTDPLALFSLDDAED